jgi:hypothetical protein
MQDPIHVLTKLRNRLLSQVVNLKMGDYSINLQDLINLFETRSKIEHNLIKSDVNPKDRQKYVKSFLKRCEQISVMNSIKARSNHMRVHNFKFPEHHKNKNNSYNYSINNNRQLNITEHGIEKIINSAFETAKKYVSMVNMAPLLRNKKIYSLVELSKFVQRSSII